VQLSSSFLLYVDVACILLVLAYILGKKPGISSTTPLIILFLSGAFWIICHSMSLIQQQLIWSFLWNNISAMGLIITPFAWLSFALVYSNRFYKINKSWIIGLSILPIITLICLLINMVWLFYEENLDRFRSSLFLVYAPELAYFFTVYSIVSYACISIGTLILVYNAIITPKLQRKQATIIAIAAVLPALGDLIYFTVASHVPYMTIYIICISISVLLITWGLVRYKLFQIVPVAYDKVIENNTDGIIVYDRFFHILTINPVAQQLVSQSNTTWINSQQQIFPTLQMLIQAYKPQGELREQCIHQTSAGQTIYILSIMPLFDQVQRINAHIVTLQNNSEQAQAASTIAKQKQEIQQLRDENYELSASLQQLQFERTQIENELIHSKEAADIAERTKQRFLANMSHELRTPLTAILGYAELIQLQAQYARNTQIGHDIKLIYTSGKQLLSLIDDLLDITQLESEQIELQISAFDIATQIDTLVEAMQARADKRQNRISVQYPLDLGSMVSDLKRVRQVLFNLLDNAIKFTEKGQITIHVRIEQDAKDGLNEQIVFEISDTGIGISPIHQQMIFQQFTQVDNSGTRKYEGAGIGLSISQRLAHLLGGNIKVSSSLGNGSTFTVRLPRQIKQTNHSV
jgi:signal transduction histidine kinase